MVFKFYEIGTWTVDSVGHHVSGDLKISEERALMSVAEILITKIQPS